MEFFHFCLSVPSQHYSFRKAFAHNTYYPIGKPSAMVSIRNCLFFANELRSTWAISSNQHDLCKRPSATLYHRLYLSSDFERSCQANKQPLLCGRTYKLSSMVWALLNQLHSHQLQLEVTLEQRLKRKIKIIISKLNKNICLSNYYYYRSYQHGLYDRPNELAVVLEFPSNVNK